MSNTLYSFVDVDRSRKVRWMLCELGIPFDEKRLDWNKGDNKSSEFLAISPFGLVPGVNLAGVPLFESSAICAFLADQYSEKHLAPRLDSPLRAAYTSWLFFGATTLENEIMEVVRWKKEKSETKRYDEALENLTGVLTPLNVRLSAQEYLCGATFTAADVVAGFPLAVANETGLLSEYDAIGRYIERLKRRPAAEESKIFTAKFPAKA